MNTNSVNTSVHIMYPNKKTDVQKFIKDKKTFCIGEDASSPHPKVFLSLKTKETKCPYCGVIFINAQ